MMSIFRWTPILPAAALFVTLSGGAPLRAGAPTSSGRPELYTDDTGARVRVAGPPQRIVSLAPGATEMLFVAGAGARVIATVAYADEPAAARRVPRIGDVTAVDMERLLALRPDLAVVWPGGGNPAQIEQLERLHIAVYRQEADRLADLPGSLRRLALAVGTAELAEPAARALESRIATLHAAHATGPHPRVLLQVWNHPIYTVSGRQLMSDALKQCGAANVFADLHDLSPVVDVEAVLARDPDVIVAAAPVGEGAAWLAEWRRFGALKAVRTGALLAFEDQALSRLGPSVLPATEALCGALDAAVSRAARSR